MKTTSKLIGQDTITNHNLKLKQMNNEIKKALRPIKFRAMQKHGVRQGAWWYGYFSKDATGTAYITTLDGVDTVEVNETTIGQFTGLTDKNGKEIYEGDKLKTENDGYAYVIWDDAAFAMKSPGSEAVDWVHSSEYSRTEVIGNIHQESEVTNG